METDGISFPSPLPASSEMMSPALMRFVFGYITEGQLKVRNDHFADCTECIHSSQSSFSFLLLSSHPSLTFCL